MRQITALIGIASCFMWQSAIQSQGLFESAGKDTVFSGAGKEPLQSYSLNGYARGGFYAGQNNDDEAVISSANSQLSVKLGMEQSGIGKAFAEVRFNAGTNRDSSSILCDVREVWAAVSLGPFDIRLGRQIMSWGRADGINPTNNITPKDVTLLSSEFDDTRLGNELLQARVTIGPSSIQGIWIPRYRADVLPLDGAKIPAGITIARPDYPDMRFCNGGYALRAEWMFPSVDGSVSYFNGYTTLPGFDFSAGQSGLSIVPHAYRVQAAGADLATVLGSTGVRGEAALKYPFDDFERLVCVPNPYLEYILGLDRSFGNWNVLVQYAGLYVIDYKKIEEPVLSDPFDPLAQAAYAYALAAAEIEELNRLFTGTSDRISHSLAGNVQWNTLYETLHLKLAGMYNFTTEDYMINPSLSYDIADAVNLAVGGRHLDGPPGSLYRMINNLMSFVYAELEISF
ncbi:hypothetical protein JW998_04360 [candidate division KSB1 bacterium]|nr:hypothetical protein [candidate division KSB1 bacterium]